MADTFRTLFNFSAGVVEFDVLVDSQPVAATIEMKALQERYVDKNALRAFRAHREALESAVVWRFAVEPITPIKLTAADLVSREHLG